MCTAPSAAFSTLHLDYLLGESSTFCSKIVSPLNESHNRSCDPAAAGERTASGGTAARPWPRGDPRWRAEEQAQHTWPSHFGAVKHPNVFHEPFGHCRSVGPTPCCLTLVSSHGPTAMEKHTCVKARAFCAGLRSDSLCSPPSTAGASHTGIWSFFCHNT